MSRLEPSCPCARDCAERSALCHTVCERYALYRAQKEADYTNRARQAEAARDATAGYRKAVTRLCRRKHNHVRA